MSPSRERLVWCIIGWTDLMASPYLSLHVANDTMVFRQGVFETRQNASGVNRVGAVMPVRLRGYTFY